MKNDPKGQTYLKIGELAQRSGCSVSTIKYYVKEGLLPIAYKTGPNMAYYSPDCVTRVQAIKTLKRERFYPLCVIKAILAGKDPDGVERALMDAINKTPAEGATGDIPYALAQKDAGLSREQMTALCKSGVIHPRVLDGKKTITFEEFKILGLAARRLQAGLPFSHTLIAFSAYARQLREAARLDVDSMIRHALLPNQYATEEITAMIRVSDQTLDEFVALKRNELNREYGSTRIGDMTAYIAPLRAFVNEGLLPALARLPLKDPFVRFARAQYATGLGPMPEPEAPAYTLLVQALGGQTLKQDPPPSPLGEVAGVLARLFKLAGGASLAAGIAITQEIKEYFMRLDHRAGGTSGERLFLYALKMAFFALAPPVLDTGGQAALVRHGFPQLVRRELTEETAAYSFIDDIENALRA